MRAHLLLLLCLSAAVTCQSDAVGPERSFEAETKQELTSIDSEVIASVRTLTTSARTGLAEPVSPVARHDASAESADTELLGPESEIAPESATTQVHYALARHVERAEQWRGDTQLFDFGEPGDAKYTLAGWLGHQLSREQHDGKSTLRLFANNLKLVLPVEREDRSQLTLVLRTFAPARLVISCNGQLATTALLSGNGNMETVSVALPSSALKRGDNLLELRLYARTEAYEPGFALDYALLGPKLSKSKAALPKPTSQAEFRPDPRRDRLVVPTGVTLAYTLEVPVRGRLETTVSSEEPGQLQVSVQRDNEPAKLLGSIEAGVNGKRNELDLRAYAGQVVRLQLRADNADVTLDEPVITAPGEAVGASSGRRPIRNVIVYLVDTLRADRLAPYNRKTRVQTPGLSRFVESAAVLTNARSQENWTKPSVATLLSSLLPWEHNAFGDASVLPNSVQVLPEILQQQGFNTAGFIANGYVSDKFGFKQGFTTYHNYIREGRRCVAQSVASDVLQWLDARPQDKPFFLYVHTIDTHVPYQPPRDYLDLYDTSKYEGPINFQKHSALLDEIKLGRLPVATRDRERLLSLYDAAISYHDVYFNVIMNGLEQRGLDGDTMVIVTADHGEEFWDHGSVGHGHSLYDELLHVPLLFRVPGVTHAGDRVRTNVGLVDVAPTILDALGVDAPENMTGRSFLPELLGNVADAPRVTVSGFMQGSRSLAVGRYKLVQQELSQSALYDTRADPQETRDLAGEKPIVQAYVRGLLGLTLGRESGRAPRAQVAHAARDTHIDANTEKQLRALGYVGNARR
jgi:choline-sulfatase